MTIYYNTKIHNLKEAIDFGIIVPTTYSLLPRLFYDYPENIDKLADSSDVFIKSIKPSGVPSVFFPKTFFSYSFYTNVNYSTEESSLGKVRVEYVKRNIIPYWVGVGHLDLKNLPRIKESDFINPRKRFFYCSFTIVNPEIVYAIFKFIKEIINKNCNFITTDYFYNATNYFYTKNENNLDSTKDSLAFKTLINKGSSFLYDTALNEAISANPSSLSFVETFIENNVCCIANNKLRMTLEKIEKLRNSATDIIVSEVQNKIRFNEYFKIDSFLEALNLIKENPYIFSNIVKDEDKLIPFEEERKIFLDIYNTL